LVKRQRAGVFFWSTLQKKKKTPNKQTKTKQKQKNQTALSRIFWR
jgi:hypothetical protein